MNQPQLNCRREVLNKERTNGGAVVPTTARSNQYDINHKLS